MPLDQNQLNQLSAWTNSKGVNANCPACGRNNWSTGDIVTSPVFTKGGGISIGGPQIPMVQLICGNCAHVRLFAAVPIGLDK